jgi:hypothetical protein
MPQRKYLDLCSNHTDWDNIKRYSTDYECEKILSQNKNAAEVVLLDNVYRIHLDWDCKNAPNELPDYRALQRQVLERFPEITNIDDIHVAYKDTRKVGDGYKQSVRFFIRDYCATMKDMGIILSERGFTKEENWDFSIYNSTRRVLYAINQFKSNDETKSVLKIVHNINDPTMKPHPLNMTAQYLYGTEKQLFPKTQPITKVEPKKKQEINKDISKDLDDVTKCLSLINPDIDYMDWFKCVVSIKNTLDEDGYELADEWSSKGAKYDSRAFNKQWYSCKDSKITLGTLKHYAKEADAEKYKELFPYNPQGDTYESMKIEFEKDHCKVLELSLFMLIKDDNFIPLTEAKLRISYKHMNYIKDNKNKSFIETWLCDSNMRLYNNVGVYPPSIKCPKDILNMWLPFKAELNPYPGDDTNAVEMFKTHVDILCNHEPAITTMVINWIAQMLQYPHLKTWVPTFQSDQGAGKGTLFDMITLIMGNTRTLETSSLDHVFGKFNSQMQTNYFILLDEVNKQEMILYDKDFKACATNGSVLINKKGIDSFKITSYHRFMKHTNNLDSCPISKDDRRNTLIKCSDELCDKEKNKDYWTNIRKMMADENAIKSIYNYLMSIPNLEDFHTKPTVKSSYHTDIVVKNTSIEEEFIKWLACDMNINMKTDELKSTQIYDAFIRYLDISGNKDYKINSKTLLLRISYLKIEGVTKKQHRLYNTTILDYDKIRKKYEQNPDLNN